MKNRIGETSIHRATGQVMTITRYKNSKDIDVQFEDGTLVENKKYSAFKKGLIRYPVSYRHSIGEKSIHKLTGQEMTLIAYRGCRDVDILFEDGSILRNRPYYNFKIGNVKHPNIRPHKCGKYLGHERIGETSISTSGKLMTIIKYRRAQDLDVQFEDGVIVRHRTYRRFKQGQIAHPNLPQVHPKQIKNTVGEQRVNKAGELLTIIKRYDGGKVDVQFEDGKIKRNVSRQSFLTGDIIRESRVDKYINERKERIGTTIKANNGLSMEVVAYNRYNDITVRFEDGTIVEHKRWQAFLRGEIGHPTIKSFRDKYVSKLRVGDTNVAHNGMKMTVIEYRGCDDIDVQFEDGTIVKHKTYTNFRKGNIANKNINSKNKNGGR